MKRKSLFSVKSYILYFLALAFAITCCFLLFFSVGDLPKEHIERSAKLTFANVILLSGFFTVLSRIHKRFTVEEPVNRILEATEKAMEGDFSVRIPTNHTMRSQNELDVITDNFNKMMEELSGIETLRSDFISNVSHELKTPIATIHSYAAMLKNPELSDEKKQEYAQTIEDASGKLSNLISNILQLNKLENQQIYPEIYEYDLGNQLTECILAFEHVWEKKKIEIVADIDERIKVKSSPELLELAWNNLLSNAIKFTEPGGIVTVSLKDADDEVIVMIADTGCGMKPEVGKHIFEKFYQGDTSHATQGNGLGLALVKRVIDIVGGDVFVESEYGKGTAFYVSLQKKK